MMEARKKTFIERRLDIKYIWEMGVNTSLASQSSKAP
jgi:hypothetical protein